MKGDAVSALGGAALVGSLWIITELGIPQRVLKRVRLLMSGEKRRLRAVKDGYSGPTEDLSLFYSMDQKALTTVRPEEKRLPAELYQHVVELLPILCIDLAVERPSDGKLLLVKRGSEPARGFWWPPGGRVYKHETIYAAAKRKTKEETGVLAEPLGVLGFFNTFFNSSAWGDSDTHTINIIVHLRMKSNEVVLDDTSEEHCWISPDEAQKYDPYVQEIVRMVQSRVAL